MWCRDLRVAEFYEALKKFSCVVNPRRTAAAGDRLSYLGRSGRLRWFGVISGEWAGYAVKITAKTVHRAIGPAR